MATKRKAAKAATTIAERNTGLGWGDLCRFHTTDPVVGSFEHTEFFTQLDKPTQNKVMATKLEAEANVHKTIADANTQMANILKSSG